jgi:hypothetical protein
VWRRLSFFRSTCIIIKLRSRIMRTIIARHVSRCGVKEPRGFEFASLPKEKERCPFSYKKYALDLYTHTRNLSMVIG